MVAGDGWHPLEGCEVELSGRNAMVTMPMRSSRVVPRREIPFVPGDEGYSVSGRFCRD